MTRKQYEVPKDTIDLLSTPRPKRDRSWDMEQLAKGNIHTYRGIPEQLHQEIKALAGEMDVAVGDMTRALLEYGLEAYRAGDLQLVPVVVETKKTLHPEE